MEALYKLLLDKLNFKIIIYNSRWITFTIYISSIILCFNDIFTIYSQLVAIISGVSFILLCFKKYLNKQSLVKSLKRLSKDEKIFLKKYLDQDTKTQLCYMINGVSRGLEQNFIIYRASNLVIDNFIVYNIQPWAWDYLQDHPEFLNYDPS